MNTAFDANHYVPILKIKKGEKEALSLVAAKSCPRITPLLEFVARKSDKTLAAHLNTAFKGLAESVKGFPRCFLDCREIAPDGTKAARAAFAAARSAGISFVPVTGISRSADVAAALKEQTHGLAVRLTREEFENGILQSRLGAFLMSHNLAPESIDLIVDLGAMDQLVGAGIKALSAQFMGAIPEHKRWRTFTLAGSTFPASMSVVRTNSSMTVPRLEWSNWVDICENTSIARMPTFGDCGIQHPKGVEDFDFRTMAVSASVRYALEEEWLLIKGQSTKVKPPSEQFPRLASQLTKGACKAYFDGSEHCEGCKQITLSASGQPKLGSATVWRRIGTVHHIEKVMQGLDALPWL